MKLNGLNLASYSLDNDNMEVNFWLQDVMPEQVVAIEAPYVIKDDDEHIISQFDGYTFKAMQMDGELVRLDVVLSVEPATEDAIKGITANVDQLITRMDNVENVASPQLTSAASMYVKSAKLGHVDAISVYTLYDEWKSGVEYKKDGYVRYDGDLYHIEQDHTSQDDWTPSDSPSLFTRYVIAPDGIRVWVTPKGSTDSFDMDEKVHYPDAEGAIYVSKRDGNTSVPGEDEWWKVYTEESDEL